jgi:hypothetical protein
VCRAHHVKKSSFHKLHIRKLVQQVEHVRRKLKLTK